jgi:hypothetical protein
VRADIGWICVADHAGEQLLLHPGATVTLSGEERWAYCRVGATAGHRWRARESLNADEVQTFGPPSKEHSDETASSTETSA